MNLAGRKKRALVLSIWFVIAISVSAVALISCFHTRNVSPDAPKEFKTKTGKTIMVLETHPDGQSLSTIEIRIPSHGDRPSRVVTMAEA